MFKLHAAAASLALLSGAMAQSSAATITATSINSQQASAMISDLSSYFVSYQSQFTRTADPSVLSLYSEVADTITAFVPVATGAAESQVVSMFVESFSDFRDAINSAVTLDTNSPQVSAILGDASGFLNQTVKLTQDIAGIVNKDTSANSGAALKISAGLAAAAAVVAVVL